MVDVDEVLMPKRKNETLKDVVKREEDGSGGGEERGN